eukprot:COSAG04_NODE_878_length_9680_cov_2.690951_11_plen_198_part_00
MKVDGHLEEIVLKTRTLEPPKRSMEYLSSYRKKAAKSTRSNSGLSRTFSVAKPSFIAATSPVAAHFSAASQSNIRRKDKKDIVFRTCGFERGNLGAQALRLLHSVPGGTRGRAVYIKQRKASSNGKAFSSSSAKRRPRKCRKGKRLEMWLDSGLGLRFGLAPVLLLELLCEAGLPLLLRLCRHRSVTLLTCHISRND